MTSSLPVGLRERKKAKTRAAIRAHGMRLFAEQGYAATTVDQIAEAAEVSQSTFFRYFPTKEDLVLTDEYDPAIVAAMRAMPPAMNAALSALSVERSGVGSGLLQALRQVGGAVGVAVLGTVLNSGYRDALPAGVGEGVRDSASAGVAVATRTGDAGLLDSVRSAFTHGMDHSLLTAGVIALVGAVLALLYLPVRPERPPVTGSPIPVSPLPAAESVV